LSTTRLHTRGSLTILSDGDATRKFMLREFMLRWASLGLVCTLRHAQENPMPTTGSKDRSHPHEGRVAYHVRWTNQHKSTNIDGRRAQDVDPTARLAAQLWQARLASAGWAGNRASSRQGAPGAMRHHRRGVRDDHSTSKGA